MRSFCVVTNTTFCSRSCRSRHCPTPVLEYEQILKLHILLTMGQPISAAIDNKGYIEAGEISGSNYVDRGGIPGDHDTFTSDAYHWIILRTLNSNMCFISVKLIWERNYGPISVCLLSLCLPAVSANHKRVSSSRLETAEGSSNGGSVEGGAACWAEVVGVRLVHTAPFLHFIKKRVTAIKQICNIATKKVARKET